MEELKIFKFGEFHIYKRKKEGDVIHSLDRRTFLNVDLR